MSRAVKNTVSKCYSNYRTFSRSCIRKETENKLPQSEPPKVDQSHMPPPIMRLVEPKDRIWLLYGSKKYKTKADIPKYVLVSELAAAQNRLRIKVCNYMMAAFALMFIGVSVRAKMVRKEDESLTEWELEKLRKWQEEGARERAEKAAKALQSSSSSK